MRRYTTGWEHTTNLADMHDGGGAGGSNYFIEVSATSPRTGGGKLRAYRTAGFSGTTGSFVETRFTEGTVITAQQSISSAGPRTFLLDYNGNARCGARVFFNVATLPTGIHTIAILSFLDSSNNRLAYIYFSGGSLRMQIANGSGKILFTPTTATWYRIACELKTDTGVNGVFRVMVFAETTNVVVAGQVSTATTWASADVDRVRLGMEPFGGGGTANADWAFDDFAVNDDQGSWDTTAPGYGAVRGIALPTADASPLDFVTTGSATHYQNVDDWVDTTDYNTTPAGAVTAEDDYDHTSSATIGVSGTIQNVMVWCTHADVAGEDGANHRVGIVDSSGNYLTSGSSLSITVDDSQLFRGINLGGFGYDVIGASGTLVVWTNSEFDNAANELFVRHTSAAANQRLRLYSIRAEVEDDGNLGLANPFLYAGDSHTIG